MWHRKMRNPGQPDTSAWYTFAQPFDLTLGIRQPCHVLCLPYLDFVCAIAGPGLILASWIGQIPPSPQLPVASLITAVRIDIMRHYHAVA